METSTQPENESPQNNAQEQNSAQGASRWKSFWQSIEPTVRIVIFAGTLMGLFFFGYKLHNWRTEVNTMRFLQPYLETDQIISTRIQKISSGRALTEQEKMATLKVQYKILTERKNHHRELAGFFVANYYASILIVLFSSISGGIIVFIIANRGWSRTNAYVKAVFFVLSFMAIFFAVFPNVFGQKGNFEQNLDAFLRYDNLQVEIFNYMSTGSEFNMHGQTVSTDSMITYVNQRIIELNQIYIDNGRSRLDKASEMYNRFQNLQQAPSELPATVGGDSAAAEAAAE